jgi:hypothetical protein
LRCSKAYDAAVRIQPYLGTLLGMILGMIAVMVWLLTFEPHGGPEYSRWLFPAARPLLDALYPQQAPPMPVFFFAALGHWLLPGVLVDLVRAAFRRLSPAASKPGA